MHPYATPIILLLACLSGCAHHSFNHFAYDALHARHCVKEEGVADCEPEHLSYEEYEKQRKEVRKRD